MKIVITGASGIGKSLVSQELFNYIKYETDYNATLYLEQVVDSIYWPLYYKNPKEWAHISQLNFLSERFKETVKNFLVNKKNNLDIKKTISIYDRDVIDDIIFEKLHLISNDITKDEYNQYLSVYSKYNEKLKDLNQIPDIVFILKTDLDNIIKRIGKRARKEELKMPRSYWEKFYNLYYEDEELSKHFKDASKKVIYIEAKQNKINEIVEEIFSHIKAFLEK